MRVDDSYAEYVAARWSALYRLAVLLVGEDAADEVTQEALVRAYVTWPHRPEDDPPDEHVTALLARLALTTTPVPTLAGLPEAEALTARQRVVVVLRCFELLDDHEIARSIGCGRELVVTDAAEALALLRASESDLGDALTRAADTVAVPLPPVEALLAGGRDARRRSSRRVRRRAAAVASVLLLALAIGSFLQAHPLGSSAPGGPIPATLASLPTGKAPRTAYAERRTLHLAGGKSVLLPASPTAIAAADGGWYVSFANGTILRVDSRTLVTRLVTDTAAGPAVTDRLGRYAAWLAAAPGPPLVVVEPTDPHRTGSSIRTQRFPDCCDGPLHVDGITPTGDVVVSFPVASRAWLWQPPGTFPALLGGVRQIAGIGNGVVHQVTPTDLVVYKFPYDFVVGKLEGDAFLATEEVWANAADFADPRGRRVVYADDAGRIQVGRRRAREDAHDLRLRLPGLSQGYRAIRWEDEDHVLLDVADGSLPRGGLVRCDARNGACEIVVRFDGPHLLAQ